MIYYAFTPIIKLQMECDMNRTNKQPIVSAFKANEIMQVSHLSIDIAQKRYSALVEKLKQMD